MSYNKCIRYEKNFLKQVICRIDFSDFIENDSIINSNVEKKIKSFFPVVDNEKRLVYRKTNISKDLITSESNSTTNEKIGYQRTYKEQNKENILVISNQLISIDYRDYSSFSEFRRSILDVMEKVLKKDANITVSRIGLRYINIYDVERIKLIKKYFNENIKPYIKRKSNLDDATLVRSLNTEEYIFDDMMLYFKYGLYNRYYPKIMEYDDFTLDYDCFVNGAFSGIEDISNYIDKAHDNIFKTFENSISDEFKDYMRRREI